jgi:hypothetical protein
LKQYSRESAAIHKSIQTNNLEKIETATSAGIRGGWAKSQTEIVGEHTSRTNSDKQE